MLCAALHAPRRGACLHGRQSPWGRWALWERIRGAGQTVRLWLTRGTWPSACARTSGGGWALQPKVLCVQVVQPSGMPLCRGLCQG